MSDLISRQDAIEAVNDCGICIQKILDLPSAESEEFEWCHDCKEYDQEAHCCHRWTKVIRNTVEELKAERTGHWININEGRCTTCVFLKCSVCGEVDSRMYRSDNYCPNCGARMVSEDV